jgi:predicted NUDIX family NTP pyrophosphohydrolase
MKSSSRKSAGLLMYRIRNGELEVLLAHPGGPFFKNKDSGHWSIPKGEPDDDEELLDAAKREFREETGLDPTGEYFSLGQIVQKGGKTVYAWGVKGDIPLNYEHKSNSFETEWPLKSGKKMMFAEIDKIEFFPLNTAKIKIKEAQIPLIERLEEVLKEQKYN